LLLGVRCTLLAELLLLEHLSIDVRIIHVCRARTDCLYDAALVRRFDPGPCLVNAGKLAIEKPIIQSFWALLPTLPCGTIIATEEDVPTGVEFGVAVPSY